MIILIKWNDIIVFLNQYKNVNYKVVITVETIRCSKRVRVVNAFSIELLINIIRFTI